MSVNLTITFVAAFAVVCLIVSGFAVVRIWKSDEFSHKPLWVLGCLLGFVGFAVDPRKDGHLLFQFGVQIPVIYLLWSSAKGLALKAMFPVIAVVALTKLGGRDTIS